MRPNRPDQGIGSDVTTVLEDPVCIVDVFDVVIEAIGVVVIVGCITYVLLGVRAPIAAVAVALVLGSELKGIFKAPPSHPSPRNPELFLRIRCPNVKSN